jgi:hypothetical protein
MTPIEVDQEVIDYVSKAEEDYRVCTSCSGAIILPVSYKPPKESDIKVKAGKRTLYISRVQARYIDRVCMDMMYDPDRGISCSMYPDL